MSIHLAGRAFPGATRACIGALCIAGTPLLLTGCGTSTPFNPATIMYPLSATVSGLQSGTTLVLTDNGDDTLSITANGTFTFAKQIPYQQSYSVSIQSQPQGQRCLATNVSGTNVRQPITTIAIDCETPDTVLVSFGSSSTDGTLPIGSLVQASDGNFYGVTTAGGATQGAPCDGNLGCGTIFRLSGSGQYTTLYSFGLFAGDGNSPQGGLIQASDGALYGTTGGGGTSSAGGGTFYRLTLDGVVTILYSFGANASDGLVPAGELLQAADGNFYGTTQAGGASSLSGACSGLGCGTVFRITPQGVETVLYSFGVSADDGIYPNGALVQGSDGNLYGTTYQGGAHKVGTVFRISTSGAYALLYSFGGTSTDGINPLAPLVAGADGNFYGTTYMGGTLSGNTGTPFGTAYVITPAGVESVLHTFAYASNDGAGPEGKLVFGADGALYGATPIGGATNSGTLFRLTTAGAETLLYSFTGSPDGASAKASPIFGQDGLLYGTTANGGTFGCMFVLGCGTAYRFNPAL